MTYTGKYKYIFFDLDRTLWDFDTNSATVLHEIYLKYGLAGSFRSPDEFISGYDRHNNRLWDEYRKGTTTKEILRNLRFQLTLEDVGISDPDLSQEIGDYYLDRSPRMSILFEGAFEILTYLLEKGYRLFILTNGFRSTQIAKMANSGLDAYFERMFTSEEIGVNKPGREIFHWAVSSLGVLAEECLMIGDDNIVDVEGASNYGMDAVWFNPEKLEGPTKAVLIIETLSGLKALL